MIIISTLAVTFTAAAGNAGGGLRRLAKAIEQVAANVPDRVTTGADTVLTINNAPATGAVSVQITAGPYQSTTQFAG